MLVVILAVWFSVSLALLLGLALAARKPSVNASSRELTYFAKNTQVPMSQMPLVHAKAIHHHAS